MHCGFAGSEITMEPEGVGCRKSEMLFLTFILR